MRGRWVVEAEAAFIRWIRKGAEIGLCYSGPAGIEWNLLFALPESQLPGVGATLSLAPDQDQFAVTITRIE